MSAFLATAWELLTSKLAGPIAAGAAVVLGILLAVARIDAAGAHAEAKSLRQEITRPVSGWAAQLERCKASRLTVEQGLKDQNAKVRQYADIVGAQLLDATKALAKVQKGKAAAEDRARLLLTTPATGNVCVDLNAADAALLRSLPR